MRKCLRCSAENPTHNRFCGQCGQSLEARDTAERRLLTVIERGIERMRAGIQRQVETRTGLTLPYMRLLLAELSPPEEAMRQLDLALEQARRNGELVWEAELLRARSLLTGSLAERHQARTLAARRGQKLYLRRMSK